MQNQKQEVNKWLTSADVVPEAVLFFAEVAEATKHLKTVILAITAKVSEQLNVLLATEKVILKTKNKEVKLWQVIFVQTADTLISMGTVSFLAKR